MNPADRTAQHLESIWRDALVIRSQAAGALDHIEDCLAGYPAQAVGADPNTAGRDLPNCRNCNGHGCLQCAGLGVEIPDPEGDVPLTGPERAMEAALAGHRDRALTDHQAIRHDITEAYNLLRSVSHRISNWWTPNTAEGRNADARNRAAVDNDMCRNHAAHGFNESIGEGGRRGLCRWCMDIEDDPRYKTLPDRVLLEQHDRGRRLGTRDYEAFLLRIQDRKQAAKDAKKAAQTPNSETAA